MKARLIGIGIIAALSILVLSVLYQSEDNPNKHKNGFQRKFVLHVISGMKVASFENNFFQFCGSNPGQFYFCDRTPGKIYITGPELNRMDTVQLRLPFIPDLAPVFYTVVQYPEVFILGGNIKIIISGNLITKQYAVHHLKTGPFGNVSIDGNGNFILRDIDTVTYDALFKKVNIQGDVLQTDRNISLRMHDFGFLYYGKLTYDLALHLFFYVSRFSNRISCFDSSLTLHYIRHTIDTSVTPKINFAKKQISATIKSPPFTINQDACSSRGLLFVHSGLKADNERMSEFNDHAVIDMYNEISAAYLGSFTIPNYKGEALKAFNIINKDKGLVFYEKHIVCYDLNHI